MTFTPKQSMPLPIARERQVLKILREDGEDGALVREIRQALVECLADPRLSSEVATNLLKALRIQLVSCPGLVADDISITEALHPWQEELAKSWLTSEDHANVTIEAIALACGLSAANFSQAFKATTGELPQRWRLLRKLEVAQTLMSRTAMSLTQVSSECGFSEQSHFNHAFVKIFGESPGSWRRRRAQSLVTATMTATS